MDKQPTNKDLMKKLEELQKEIERLKLSDPNMFLVPYYPTYPWYPYYPYVTYWGNTTTVVK